MDLTRRSLFASVAALLIALVFLGMQVASASREACRDAHSLIYQAASAQERELELLKKIDALERAGVCRCQP